jgi:hypothetical protein
MRYLPSVVAIAGCALGAPPGFAPHDRTSWSFPLVDPLADHRLVTPVYVDGHGPFLFAIDPDAPATVVDADLVHASGLVMFGCERAIDHRDVTFPMCHSDLPSVRVGELQVSSLRARVVSGGALFEDMRAIRGVLGHDITVDSLVFGFDRERGVAWLATEDSFQAPDGARVLAYDKAARRVAAPEWQVPRRMVHAAIDGVEHALHVDLGRAASELRPSYWDDAKLDRKAASLAILDDLGRGRAVDRVGIADRVTVQGVARQRVAFVAFDDRRYFHAETDGTLALDFFEPFRVEADWHHARIYLTPRVDSRQVRTARLARWGAPIATCRHAGCVELVLSDTALEVMPEPVDGDLDIVAHATSRAGAALPALEIVVPRGTAKFAMELDERYRDATLEVIDAAPFARTCANGGACVVVPGA